MANVTTSQIVLNGERNAIVRLTNFSDGTDETDVLKVDATKTGPLGAVTKGKTIYPGTGLCVRRIWYDINGMTVRVLWKGAPSADMLVLSGFGDMNLGEFSGLIVPADVSSATGSISVSTVGAMAGSAYSLILFLNK